MNIYKADLHIHTVLSPCANLEMSPSHIITQAKNIKLDIIGITDHNSTMHCALAKNLGNRNDIFVLTGAEITTSEEIHCLTFFDKTESLEEFQQYLSQHLPFIKNKPSLFGYQVVVNEKEEILEEIESLLIVALDQSINQVQAKVRELQGIFIPAHIDRPHHGLLGQLGLMPDNLYPDAIEIAGNNTFREFLNIHPEFKPYTLVRNSDAHLPEHIGHVSNTFLMDHLSFDEITMALRGENGRKVIMQ